MIPWLAVPAEAADPTVQSETVVQARHDLFGEPIVPVYEFLRVTDDPGPLRLDAYLSLSSTLPDGLHPAVHTLSAEGPLGAARWRVGTQQASTPLRPQTFDGLWFSAPIGDRRTTLTVWGGRARHDTLDDTLAGTGVARVEVLHAESVFALRVAAEADGGPSQDGLVGRQDGELRLGQTRTGWVSVRGAVAESAAAGLALEQAHGEVGSWLGKRVAASTWIERRTTSVETLLSDSVLPVFAPDGFDQGGVRVRLVGADTSSAVASAGVGRYQWQGEPVTTFSADATWIPRLGSGVPVPSWRFRTGPGGSYHAVALTEAVSLGESTRWTTHAALVPYQKLEDPWRTAAVAGTAVAESLAGHGWFELGGDGSSDAVFPLDLRAYAALTLDWP